MDTKATPIDELACALYKEGITTLIGIPCSLLKKPLAQFEDDPRFNVIYVKQERDAIAMQAGMWLGKEKSMVFTQNSGLMNMTNFISSMSVVYNAPVFLLISKRGKPGLNDAPEHTLPGKITNSLLEMFECEVREFDTCSAITESILDGDSDKQFNSGKRIAMIIDGETKWEI